MSTSSKHQSIKLSSHNQKNFYKLIDGSYWDPHTLLGLITLPVGKVIRVWRPNAEKVYIELQGKIVRMQKVHDAGMFEYPVSNDIQYNDYKVYHQGGLLDHDPYTFSLVCGEVDQYLFSQGTHYKLYDIMGAHLKTHQGVEGVSFVLWAPNAKRVSIVSDFNHWNGLVNPMRQMGPSGIWELFIPGLKEGEKYKFEIKTQSGEIFLKTDPYGYSFEKRPATSSIVANLEEFEWSDQKWMEDKVNKRFEAKPMNVYEVHLGSWKRENDSFLNYRTLAHDLADYCKYMGFTHVELMPIAEHPFDQSWGYQVTGFYAPTSRFGKPQDFQYFVNHLHNNGIGVILDWVPGHFPKDAFALARFDGSALYEHEDPCQSVHPHWGTLIFNHGRNEVSNFLIANALFWLDKMHIDGLRVDAVASMLYLDYGRENEDWVPNKYGGKENLDVINFLKHLNSIIPHHYPGTLMIAEESTSFDGVTRSVCYDGLGFDMKWNMGWMNDTLKYFSKDPLFRQYNHNALTFGLLYAFTENFMLVMSHDEVVHGKKSLISKMPGDYWQKFANLRLLYSYMICQPGKNLLFMGSEFAQWDEWDSQKSIDWHLLNYDTHRSLHNMIRDMNHLSLNHCSLWKRDFDWTGFQWVSFEDNQNSTVCYLRKSDVEELLIIHNMTPVYHPTYFIPLGNLSRLEEIFNTDAAEYGGSDKVFQPYEICYNEHANPVGVNVSLAPLATMVYRVFFV